MTIVKTPSNTNTITAAQKLQSSQICPHVFVDQIEKIFKLNFFYLAGPSLQQLCVSCKWRITGLCRNLFPWWSYFWKTKALEKKVSTLV